MDTSLTPALTLLDSVVRFGEYDYRVKSKSAKVSRVAYELRIIFGYECTVRVPYYDFIYNRHIIRVPYCQSAVRLGHDYDSLSRSALKGQETFLVRRLEVKPHVQTYGLLSLGPDKGDRERFAKSLEITRKYAAAHLAIGPDISDPAETRVPGYARTGRILYGSG